MYTFSNEQVELLLHALYELQRASDKDAREFGVLGLSQLSDRSRDLAKSCQVLFADLSVQYSKVAGCQ